MDSITTSNLSIQTSTLSEEGKSSTQSSPSNASITGASEALGKAVSEAAPSLETLTAQLSLSSPVKREFSPESVQALLEVGMQVEPPLDSRTFNSFMPPLALAAAGVPESERQSMLAATLILFGEEPGSDRADKLHNAVFAFPSVKPDGGAWTWMEFADPMNDPLDDKNVYEL